MNKNQQRKQRGKGRNKNRGVAQPFSNLSRQNQLVTNPISFGRNAPFPPRLRTTLRLAANFFMAAANAAQQYLITIWGNSIFEPLTTGNITNGSASTYATNTTGSTALSTCEPVGYANWNQIYKQYRVLASRLTVTATPSTIGDTALLSIAPMTDQVATLLGVVGTKNATTPNGTENSQLPFARFKQITTNNNVRQNTVSNSMTTALVNGISKQQEMLAVANFVVYNSAPSTSAGQEIDLPWYWLVSIQTLDNGNFGSSLPISLQIEFDVEWTLPITPIA